ncbi:MAG: hypothetical protein AAFO82_16295 [Bacteroidota bacterium]
MKKKLILFCGSLMLIASFVFMTYEAKAQINVPLPAKMVQGDDGVYTVFCPDPTGGARCVVLIPIL